MDHGNSASVIVLPDSRLKSSRLAVRGKAGRFASLNWVPVFCANCGIPYGYVPEENCTFACWLCDPCNEKWGAQFGLAAMPDEVFWKKVEQEQMARYGRLLNEKELHAVAQTSCNPLAKLLREHP